ncbi:hypothetical protein [Methylobacterium nigriterrae]|uniref:hypothetical protein n=1 Tax=Methylobacterium nigriterrae TaxID=3127512 RepID=UPI003013BD57
MRSRQNARKHGLAASDPDARATAAAEHLAELVAGELGADPAIREAARALAEAHAHLRRIRAFKSALIRNGIERAAIRADTGGSPASVASPELLQGLEGLERYERRAFSRRKSAARRFEALARHARRLLREGEPE